MNALLTAFRRTLHQRRVVFWMYLANLLPGLLVLFPAFGTLNALTGRSMAYETLLEGFDYTVFSDFMDRYGEAIGPLLSAGRWLGLVYWLLSVFFAGGVLLAVSRSEWRGSRPSFGAFLQGCTQYFGRFLRLALLVAGLVLATLVVLALAGSLLTYVGVDTFDERTLILLWVGLGALGALLAAYLLCIGDYAKVWLLTHDDRRAFHAYFTAGRLVNRNLGATLGPYLLLLALGGIWLGLYGLLESALPTTGWLTIGLVFGLQQLLIAGRVFLKAWTLATATVVSRRWQPAPRPNPVEGSEA